MAFSHSTSIKTPLAELAAVCAAAALDKLSVDLIALLALLLLGEQLDLEAWLGVVLMAIGAAFLSGSKPQL